jgi:hypothetical protein
MLLTFSLLLSSKVGVLDNLSSTVCSLRANFAIAAHA